MDKRDIKLLSKSIALLRVSSDQWDAIEYTQHHGSRFSLNFPHEAARSGQKNGLVLIAASEPNAALRVGWIRSIAATATFDSRVVFDLVQQVAPASLQELLGRVNSSALQAPSRRLIESDEDFVRVSQKLGRALVEQIAAIPENAPALARILAHIQKPTHYEDARALQQDAVALAVKAFGGSGEASAIALPGDETAIATVRILEDAVIEHDARWLPGWDFVGSDLTGRATFEKRGEKLEVFTANKRPLEKLFGVDLVYLNVSRGSLIMVQYKMLDTNPVRASRSVQQGDDEREWIVRINGQFNAELTRMRAFDRDLDPSGAYRLHSGAFYFKLVRRHAATNSAGILLSLGHLDHMLADGSLKGPGGGLRISYRLLDGHYLRSEPFIELIRSGYIGTRGKTTVHMQALIEESLRSGNAVVAAIQSAMAPDATVPFDDDYFTS